MEKSRLPRWLSRLPVAWSTLIFPVVTLIFGTFFSCRLNNLEKYQTVASYLNTLTDAGSPIYLKSLSRSKIWLHGVSPDGEPSGYSLPSPLKRAEIAVFRRLGYIRPRMNSRAGRRWMRNLDLLRLRAGLPGTSGQTSAT